MNEKYEDKKFWSEHLTGNTMADNLTPTGEKFKRYQAVDSNGRLS
jgi:hypothetical protein